MGWGSQESSEKTKAKTSLKPGQKAGFQIPEHIKLATVLISWQALYMKEKNLISKWDEFWKSHGDYDTCSFITLVISQYPGSNFSKLEAAFSNKRPFSLIDCFQILWKAKDES